MTTPRFNFHQSFEQLQFKEFYKNMPKTRYYGSKKRLLPWIYETLSPYDFDTVLDPFGGTASVSSMFQFMNKEVTFHDALLSNAISAEVLLNGIVNSSDISKTMIFFEDVEPDYDGVISRHYQGIFFTEEENAWLDGALQKIHNIEDNSQKNLFLYLIFQASLMKRPFNLFHRANLKLRMREDINRSFGNLTTWNRSFIETIKIILVGLAQKNVQKKQATVLQPSSAEKLATGYDLVYLDPPYVQREKKDTYWKKYHFLEGLAKYNEMEDMIENNLKIKQLKRNMDVEKWEEPSSFKNSLFSLINKHKDSIVALSYMTNAIPSEDELITFFGSIFYQVNVSYSDLNHVMSKGKKTEILIVGVPK